MTLRDPPITLLSHELRETLGRISRRLRAEPGPSIGRLAVLGRLERRGPSSISDLAADGRVRPQSMAQTIHDMEASSLVSRHPDPSDGRRTIIELTAPGHELLQTTRAQRETWLTEVLERDLTATELGLLQDALALLRRIADA